MNIVRCSFDLDKYKLCSIFFPRGNNALIDIFSKQILQMPLPQSSFGSHDLTNAPQALHPSTVRAKPNVRASVYALL